MNNSNILNRLNNFKLPHKAIISFILGGMVSFTFAKFFLFPFIFCFSAFLLLIKTSNTKKESFYIGWSFGFGYFSISLHWVAWALFTDTDKFIWLLPVSNIVFPAALGLYIAAVALFTYKFNKNKMLGLIFALNWVIIEYIRSKLFTGFPWNLIGYSFGFSLELLQLASIIGIYGLSFFAMIISLIPYIYFSKVKNKFFIIFGTICLIGSSYIYGKIRLKNQTEFHDINLHIVQGNISQHDKWKEDMRFDNLSTYMKLSSNSKENAYVIWPESAVPYNIEDIELLKYISKIIPKEGLLITGSIRLEQYDNEEKWWNSISFINSEGKIISNYNKTHLLPFGEYIPFRHLIPASLDKITYGIGDFERGIGPVTLNIDNKLPEVSPIICYEAIFPNIIVNRDHRPKWILKVTNDGWFANSNGPHQHFHMARVRAIEQGLALVRSANTGISAVIDSYGKIITSLPLGMQGVIKEKLPKALAEKTIYAKYGDKIILAIFIMLYILIIYKNMYIGKN
ncbi:MAG: apolipoprotein N-acyltransferase [Alphaproteobacteria bacterium]